MKKLWKIIKENITVVLAMTTAFLSVVYAGIRLMIYVYWMGYFKELFFASTNYLKMQRHFPKVAAGNSSKLHKLPEAC